MTPNGMSLALKPTSISHFKGGEYAKGSFIYYSGFICG